MRIAVFRRFAKRVSVYREKSNIPAWGQTPGWYCSYRKSFPMPAKQFVRVLDAVTTGLLFTYFQTPELITEDIFVAAFEALA
ncbi:MAG: hypothetical protein ABSG51_00610 [Terracidiphilus sp.]